MAIEIQAKNPTIQMGIQGPRGEQGPKGDPGADGKTPEYGVDYGTPEQIQGIAQLAVEILQPEVNQIKNDISLLQTALIGVDALADKITEVVGA